MPGPAPLTEVKCAVCETVQPPATLCATCGVPLHLPRGVVLTADPVIESIPDFEATSPRLVSTTVEDVMPDLEITVNPRVSDVPSEFVPGFEPTEELLLDLPGVDETVPDLEHTVEEFQKTPPLPPELANRCQYCGSVQASGRLCDNCGLVRSKVIESAEARDGDLAKVRCPGCGSIVPHKELCTDCGAPLPRSEEE
jgi:ribosomal protein L32